MRIVLAIVVAAGLGLTGWWYFVAHSREAALTGWLEERREDGWVAEAADISVTGYPIRHDTRMTGMRLADPDSGWSWTAEEFSIASPSHRPTEFNLVWTGPQTIASPYGTTRITAATMQGTIAFLPNSRLTLDRIALGIADMLLIGSDGKVTDIASATLATRREPEDGIGPNAHSVVFEADGIRLPADMTRASPQDAVLDAITGIRLDMTLGYDAALDLPTIEAGGPRLEKVVVRDARAGWGDLDLRGTGEVTVDARGLAEGRIDLRARNWREMVAMAEDAGYLAPGLASALRGGLDLLALLSGDSSSLRVPLDLADGRARIGPVVVGDAPRLAMPLDRP